MISPITAPRPTLPSYPTALPRQTAAPVLSAGGPSPMPQPKTVTLKQVKAELLDMYGSFYFGSMILFGSPLGAALGAGIGFAVGGPLGVLPGLAIGGAAAGGLASLMNLADNIKRTVRGERLTLKQWIGEVLLTGFMMAPAAGIAGAAKLGFLVGGPIGALVGGAVGAVAAPMAMVMAFFLLNGFSIDFS